MFILNNLIWFCFCFIGFYDARKNQFSNISTDNFLSYDDIIFSMWLAGVAVIYLWNKFALYFLNTWEVLERSPFQLWLLKHFGFWLYVVLALLLGLLDLLAIIGLPISLIQEILQIHLGDIFVPIILSFVHIIF